MLAGARRNESDGLEDSSIRAAPFAAWMVAYIATLGIGVASDVRSQHTYGDTVQIFDRLDIQAWQEAGRRIIGQTFNAPHWPDNFNLDNGATVLGETFDVVAVDRTRGTFESPDPGPVLAWVQSLRPGLEGGIEDATWTHVMSELRRVVAHEIDAHGTFATGKDSDLVIARKRAT